MTDAWIPVDTPGTRLGHFARGALYVPGMVNMAGLWQSEAGTLSNVQDKTTGRAHSWDPSGVVSQECSFLEISSKYINSKILRF